MAARYLLHGLRIWTKGVDYPAAKPFDDTEDEAALYRLMGQRVTMPDLTGYQDADPLTLTLTNPQNLAWVTLIDPATNAPGPSLAFALPKDGADWITGLLAQAKSPGLKAPIVSVAESLDAKRREKTFSFKSRTDLQAASAIALPVGVPSADPGVPTLALWTFPDALTSAIVDHQAAALAAGVPLAAIEPYVFAPKASVRTIPNRPPQIVDVAHWGYAALIDVEIKRGAATDRAAATVPTYDLVGTNQAGEKLLESLLARITPTDTMAVRDVLIVYRPNQASDRASGLQYDGEDHYKAFLIRANLSTETNLPTGALHAAAALAPRRTHRHPQRHLRLHQRGVAGERGPLGRLLAVLSARRRQRLPRRDLRRERQRRHRPPDPLRRVGRRRAADDERGDHRRRARSVRHSVYAQSVARKLEGISTDGRASRRSPTPTACLRPTSRSPPRTSRSRADPAHHRHRHPGAEQETLAQIAARFGVTDTAIRDLNPNPHIDWSNLLPAPGLAIPDIDVQVTGTATLASLALAYSSQVAAIGYANRTRAGIFAAGVTIDLDQVILEKQPQVPPGNAGLTLVRSNPGDDSAQVAVYLEQDYGLLGYDILANANFAPLPDSLALPAGPADDQSEQQLKALRRPTVAALAALAAGNDWTFKLIVPSSRLATFHAPLEPGKPDPALNPYAGVGGFIQLGLSWRDFFGDLTSSPFTDRTIDPTYPLNFTPLRVLYTDPVIGLGQWPSTECDYLYAKGASGPELQIALTFNTSRYEPAPPAFQPLAALREAGDIEDWKKNAMADRQVFANAYYQLDQSGPAPGRVPSVAITVGNSVKGAAETELSPAGRATLETYVAGAWAYLDALLAPLTAIVPQPPAPATLTLASAPAFAGDIAQIASPSPRGGSSTVAAEFRDYPAMVAAATAISPRLTKQAGGGYTLDDFAKSFEDAFAGAAQSLKLATGEDAQQAGRPAPSDASLWAVRMAVALPRRGGGRRLRLCDRRQAGVLRAGAALDRAHLQRHADQLLQLFARQRAPAGPDRRKDLQRHRSRPVGEHHAGRDRSPARAALLHPDLRGRLARQHPVPGEDPQGEVRSRRRDHHRRHQHPQRSADVAAGRQGCVHDAREAAPAILIQLANAYAVDAIVQHRVDVASGGAGPPRRGCTASPPPRWRPRRSARGRSAGLPPPRTTPASPPRRSSSRSPRAPPI